MSPPFPVVRDLLVGAAVAGACIALVSAAVAFSSASGTAILLLVNLAIFFDLLDVLIRLGSRVARRGTAGLGTEPWPSCALETGDFSLPQKRLHVRPYALVASVHNAETEIRSFLDAMASYGHALWIIDDGSTDHTRDLLEVSGCRYVAGGVNRNKPRAIRELLRHLPPEIETVVVFDPDSTIVEADGHRPGAFEAVIFDFQRSGMAAACPRLSIRRDGAIVAFQEIEYYLGLGLGRKSLADHSVTSGISIYRRSALEKALERHSLSVYAEDLENALRLLGDGERIYYDDRIVIETDGKSTVRDLFSQRVGWAYGHIRAYRACIGDVKRIARRGGMAAYQFVGYLGIITLLLHPVRVVAVAIVVLSFLGGVDSLLGTRVMPEISATDPAIFVTTYTQYLLLMVLAFATTVRGGDRRRLLPVAPFYFFYAMWLVVPVTVGLANWLAVRVWKKRLFSDHYQEDRDLLRDENGLAAA